MSKTGIGEGAQILKVFEVFARASAVLDFEV